MANEVIQHGTTEVVNASAKVTDAALSNAYANTTAADGLVANNTQMFSVTIDAKGRVTNSVAASINTTGITYANTNAAGAGSFAHLPNQKIHISSSAPANNDVGNNGDIWYQTL